MLRIGICDDHADARLTLRVTITRILDARNVPHEVFEFSSGEGLVGWLGKHAGALDLVFLDMEMGALDGMATARLLRKADAGLQIAFVTGFADYVFDGYAVGALGYVLKPPQDARLAEVLDRALAVLYREANQAFVCRNSEGAYRIPKASIRYFYSDKRLVTCATDGRDYTFYARLDEVADEVGAGFVRIHQRYLVRAGAVDRVEGGEAHLGGEALPISRKYQSEALLALTRAMLE